MTVLLGDVPASEMTGASGAVESCVWDAGFEQLLKFPAESTVNA